MTSERMLERETELDQQLNEQRMEAIRSKVPAGGMGPEFCIECDRSIFIGRRSLGYQTCIECAQDADARDAGQ